MNGFKKPQIVIWYRDLNTIKDDQLKEKIKNEYISLMNDGNKNYWIGDDLDIQDSDLSPTHKEIFEKEVEFIKKNKMFEVVNVDDHGAIILKDTEKELPSVYIVPSNYGYCSKKGWICSCCPCCSCDEFDGKTCKERQEAIKNIEKRSDSNG
jgi:hypothetical protein